MSNRTVTLGLGALAAVVSGAAAFACTSLSHANDYTIEENLLCAVCNRPDLRHVPCPPPQDTDGADSVGPLVLPLRSLGFGADTRSLGHFYHSGLDQNCAPNGVWTCNFVPFADAGIPVVPVGVDNELGATFFAHLLDHGAPDLEKQLNAGLGAGAWGMVLVVEGWNGAPDDARVTASLYTRAMGNHPQFVRDVDTWNVSDGALIVGGRAYVAGGRFVWDARRTTSSLSLVNGAEYTMSVTSLVVEGALTREGLDEASISGQLTGSSGNLGLDFVSGCSPEVAATLRAQLGLGPEVVKLDPRPDLPSLEGASDPHQCQNTSFGFDVTFGPPARIEKKSDLGTPRCPAPSFDAGPADAASEASFDASADAPADAADAD